jgi:uracil-DNA glycosylase
MARFDENMMNTTSSSNRRMTATVWLVMLIAIMCPAPTHSFLSGSIGKQQSSSSSRFAVVKKSSQTQLGADSSTVATEEGIVANETSMDILWDMAGRSGQKKRKRGRNTGVFRMKFKEDFSSKVKGYKEPETPEETGPSITSEEIASVIVFPSASQDEEEKGTTSDDDDGSVITIMMANVTLVNGTQMTVDPRELHQRQDTDVWLAVRAALDVTASEFSAVLGNSVFTTREKLLNVKSGKEQKSFVGNMKACEWGLKMEPRALRQYREVTGNAVTETGLHIRNNPSSSKSRYFGASPDGLVVEKGSKGLLEIKCLWGRRHKKELPQFDYCPNRFYDQIQGQLAVCDRDWCDLMMYIPPSGYKGRKNYCILRIQRDKTYWSKTLLPALDDFCDELDKARVEEAVVVEAV